MNQQLHRIVFNRSRGQRMVVQETARSTSGAARGETRRIAGGAAAMSSRATWRRLALAGPFALAMWMAALSADAWPQPAGVSRSPKPLLAAEPHAPGGRRPILDAARNGVPIVHVAPPSRGGVSRNSFERFNVDPSGVILNNSPRDTQSQLGGWIGANPQLGHVPARLIVNEVVGGDASTLKGTLEVAGRKADVVIANPNGLLCDGCGFLNTDRATLTTGTPRFGRANTLTGFEVERGTLTVGAGGLHAASLEQLDLIARGLVIEGEVWARNLHVLAGANQVLHASLGESPSVTARAGSGSAPRFAIDIKDLGGMIADRVYLVATEHGLGVNSTGRMAALQGNLTLSVNGDLTLKDSQARQSLQLTSAGDATLTGLSQSLGVATVRAGGTLTQDGEIDSGSALHLEGRVLMNRGTIAAHATGADAATLSATETLRNSGTVHAAGGVRLSAPVVHDGHGTLRAAGDLHVTARDLLSLQGSRLMTDGDATLASDGTLEAAGAWIDAAGAVALQAGGALAHAGSRTQAGAGVSLQGARIGNEGGTVLAGALLSVATPGAVDNAGGRLLGSAGVAIDAARLVNEAVAGRQALVASDRATRIVLSANGEGLGNRGGVVSAQESLSLRVAGAVANVDGLLVSAGVLEAQAREIDSTGGQIIAGSAGDAALEIAADRLLNTRGTIRSDGAVTIRAGEQFANTDGTVASGRSVHLAARRVDNAAGVIAADGLTSIQGERVVNDGGTVSAIDSVVVTSAEAVRNRAGRLLADGVKGTVTVVAPGLDNGGGAISAGHVALTLGREALDNTRGRVLGTVRLDVESGEIVNAQGVIGTAGALALRTRGGRLANAEGVIRAAGALSIEAGTLDNTAGLLNSRSALAVTAAGAVSNAGGEISASRVAGLAGSTGDVRLDAQAHAIDVGHGRILAEGDLDMRGGAVSIGSGGHVAGQGAASLTAASLDHAGTLQAGQALALAVGAVRNAGRIEAGAGMTLTSGHVDNRGGTVAGGRDVAVASTRLDNDGGTISARGAAALRVAGLASNVAGTVAADEGVSLHAGELDNRRGEVVADRGGTVVRAGRLVNDHGLLGGTPAVTVHATGSEGLSNVGGRIVGDDRVAVHASGFVNQDGTVAARQVLIDAAGGLDNAGGRILGTDSLRVARAPIVNAGGSISTGGDLVLDAGGASLDNAGGRIAADGALEIRAGTVGNQGGTLAGGREVAVAAGRLANAGGLVAADGDVRLSVDALHNGGTVRAGRTVSLSAAGQVDNAGGSLLSGQDLAVRAGALANGGGAQPGIAHAGRDLVIEVERGVDNLGGEIVSRRDLRLAAGDVTNDGGTLGAQGSLSLAVRGALVNVGAARIEALGASGIEAGSLSNHGGSRIAAAGPSRIEVSGTLSNDAGRIASDRTLVVTSGAASNRGGTIGAVDGVTLTTDALDGRGGRITAGRAGDGATGPVLADLSVDTRGHPLANDGGMLQATRDVAVSAGHAVNAGGTIHAGGDLSLRTASLDNAGAGEPAASLVGAGGGAVLSTGALRNAGGEISAARLSIDTGSAGVALELDNARGRIVGTERLTLRAGSLANEAGTIGSQGDAAVTAVDLHNADGTIRAGRLDLAAAGTLSSAGGEIAAVQDARVASRHFVNGAADGRAGVVSAGRDLDLLIAQDGMNAGGEIRARHRLSVTAGALTNEAGLLHAGGAEGASMQLAIGGAFANRHAGDVLSQGALAVDAGSVTNHGGSRLFAEGPSHVAVSGTLDNDGGVLGSSDTTSVASGAARNRGGVITSLAGTTLRTHGLDTRDGQVVAGRAAGGNGQAATIADLVIDTRGQALVADGATLQSTRDLTMRAADASNAGGRIVAERDIAMTAGTLGNLGGIVSAQRRLSLDAAGVDNRDGLLGAGELTIDSDGAVGNAGGTIAAAGDATIRARSLVNAAGASGIAGQVLAGRDLAVETREALSNAGASLQSGRDMTLDAGGTVVNRSGRIESRGALALGAGGTLDNAGGVIRTTLTPEAGGPSGGAIALVAAGADNTGGTVHAAGALSLATGRLSNGGGLLQSSGGGLTLTAGRTGNEGGSILSAADLSATTQAFDNTGGTVAATRGLSVDTQGAAFTNAATGVAGAVLQAGGDAVLRVGLLTNRSEGAEMALLSAGSLRIEAGDIANRGVIATGSEAGGALTLAVTGALANDGGTLHAGGRLDARAGTVSNRGGRMLAAGSAATPAAGLSLRTDGGAVDNGGQGLIAAFDGTLAIDAGGGSLSNREGGRLHAGGDVRLVAGTLDNSRLGRIEAGGALNASTGDVDNTGGLIRGNGLTLDTRGQRLTNERGAGGGIFSTGDAVLRTGVLANEAGVVAAAGELHVVARGTVDNRSGLLSGAQGLDLEAQAEDVVNRGGRITSAGGDVGLQAARVDNDGGEISAAGTARIDATVALTNRAASVDGVPSRGRIGANDIVLAVPSLDNRGGLIAADRDLVARADRIDNTGGEISARRDVRLDAPTLLNDGGRIVADRAVGIVTASTAPGGTVSGTSVSLQVQGDYHHTGTLSARADLTLTADNIVNAGVLVAANELVAQAGGDLVNAADGELSGASVRLAAGGRLDNRGLINGTADDGRTVLRAGEVSNTGRIYGDHVTVEARRIANGEAGVVAARRSLSLAASDVRNSGQDALLLSLGDLDIGGSLDDAGRVAGRADSFVNTAGRVEAHRDLRLAAHRILNANAGVRTRMGAPEAGITESFIVMEGQVFPLSQCRDVGPDFHNANCILHPEVYGLRQTVLDAYRVDQVCTGSGNDNGIDCVEHRTPNYAWSDGIFARFGIVPMSGPPPSEPFYGCTGHQPLGEGESAAFDVQTPECNQWRADLAAWNLGYAQSLDALQQAVTPYNAEVARDNAELKSRDYVLRRVTATTERTEVIESRPGQLLSGRDMTLDGADIANVDSRIVAGGWLTVNGEAGADGTAPSGVRNVSTQGVVRTTYHGSEQYRATGVPVPHDPAPTEASFDLPTLAYQQNAAQLQGGASRSAGSVAQGAAAQGAGAVGDVVVGAAAPLGSPGTFEGAAIPDSGAASSAPIRADVRLETRPGGSGVDGRVVVPRPAGPGLHHRDAGAPASDGRVELPALRLAESGSDAATRPGAGSDGAAPGGRTASERAPAASAAPGVSGGPLPGAAAAVPVVQRYLVAGSDQQARRVVATTPPRLSLPASRLFKIHAEPGARFIVETDPAFTSHRKFLGSDYFQAQLALDPERSLARYGDGFQEQRLIDDQVMALTGRRFLSGYASTETQFKALMDAGVAFARAYQLSPGVALSAEQMALLTTDIVWLVAQDVTLPDGRIVQALVPQVYLRQPQDGDLAPSGALMAGEAVRIRTAGELVNGGSIRGGAVLASGRDVVNTGSIAADHDLLLQARNDLTILSGSAKAGGTLELAAGRDVVLRTRVVETHAAASNGRGSSESARTALDRLATVQAGGDLLVAAGRDLAVHGAVLSAGGDLQATAGRDLDVRAVEGRYEIASRDLAGRNTAGRRAHTVESGVTQHAAELAAEGSLTLIAGHAVDRQADEAGTGTAGRLSLHGSRVAAGENVTLQGREVHIAASVEHGSLDAQTVRKGAYQRHARSDETLAGGSVEAGRDLRVQALDGDIDLGAASLEARHGQASLIAAGDVTLGALATEHATIQESYRRRSSSSFGGLVRRSSQSQGEHTRQSTRVEGSRLDADRVMVLAGDREAGSGDIVLQAARITAQGAAVLDAGRDVIVDTAAETSRRSDHEQHRKSFSFGPRIVEKVLQGVHQALVLPDPIASRYSPEPATHGKRASNGDAGQDGRRDVGSSVSADSLAVTAGRDAVVRGSTLVATRDLSIDAGRDLTLASSREEHSERRSTDRHDRGLFDGGGVHVGERHQAQEATSRSEAAVSSKVASLSGNVELRAGDRYRQAGSEVLALGQGGTGGDVAVTARRVEIDAARSSSDSEHRMRSEQDGATVSFGSSPQSMLQSVRGQAEAASQTDDPRLQALAAATAAMTVYDSVAATARNGVDGGITVDVGRSRSRSQSREASDTAVPSHVGAARDIVIRAVGAGGDSDIVVTGSDLSAGRRASLRAEGDITLQSAESHASLQQSSSGSSAHVGITYGAGSQNGLSIHAGASSQRGRAEGSDLVHRNTHVAAVDGVELESGGDTTLAGAVVAAQAVKADVAGQLEIRSLQDASRYDARQESAGFNVSLCIPPICYGETVTGNVHAGRAKVEGDFRGVAEQSGIKAGDGGFQVTVGGHTALAGGAIVSSQAAIDAGRNSLTTGTLTARDVENRDVHVASSASVSVGFGSTGGGSAGAGRDEGSNESRTRSAVSAGAITIRDDAAQQRMGGQGVEATLAALDTQATTDEATAGTLQRAWDGQQLMRQVNAEAQITAAFGSRAAKAVGDIAGRQIEPYEEARAAAQLARQVLDDPETGNEQRLLALQLLDVAQAAMQQQGSTYEQWKEGGALRVASHAVIAAMGGGFSGAVGAGASAALMPRIFEPGTSTGPADKFVEAAVAAALGAATGDSGIAGAFNVDTNNRQLTHTEMDRIRALANGDPLRESRLTAAACALVRCADGVPSNDPTYAYLKGLQDAGASMVGEQVILRRQIGREGRNLQALFQYGLADTVSDGASHYQVGTRLTGVAQAAGGAALIGGGTALCTSGVGCVGAAVGVVVGMDHLKAGITTAVNGVPDTTYGEKVLQSLGLSPEAASITYGLAEVSPIAAAGVAKLVGVVAAKAELREEAAARAQAIERQRIENNVYKDGNPLMDPIASPSGVLIVPEADRTTTVLGRFDLDMNVIINKILQRGYMKDFGPRSGGINVLHVKSDLPDEIFWQEVNRPFLDAAIERGDKIVLATKPNFQNFYRSLSNGEVKKTFFSREYDYLVQRGYRYDEATSTMIKRG